MEDLLIQKDTLAEDLRAAMMDGNLHEVIRIQDLLRDYPARITAARCKEIREELDSIEVRLAELKDEDQQLWDLRKERNQILADALRKAQEAQAEVKRVELARMFGEEESKGLRIRRKELKEEIDSLINSEVENGFIETK